MTLFSSDIQQAANILKEGKLVAFPTETVYGLGGNALLDNAIAGIYAAKGRPNFNPLIVHVHSLEQAQEYAQFNDIALLLAHHFWPGPLTLVLPRVVDCKLSLLLSAGLDSVAIRMPGHETAKQLLSLLEFPIAAPSANRSGNISPTQASHVMDELQDRIAMVLDGEPCSVGIESTVVDVTAKHPVILRPGSITLEMLEKYVKHITFAASDAAISAPGMLSSHYAPNHSMRLNANSVTQTEGLLAFGSSPLTGTDLVENLSVSANLEEAAANLFRMMRILDASSVSSIAVMPIPEEGLGIAINDRLKRAAAPKG